MSRIGDLQARIGPMAALLLATASVNAVAQEVPTNAAAQASGALGSPGNAVALDCGYCSDASPGGPHAFGGGAWVCCNCRPGSDGCHSEWYTDTCLDWHDTCTGEEDLEDLAAAISKEDSDAIRIAMSRFAAPNFDVRSNAVEFFCAGRLAARVPVPSSVAPIVAGAILDLF